jgi:hypothetical protein
MTIFKRISLWLKGKKTYFVSYIYICLVLFIYLVHKLTNETAWLLLITYLCFVTIFRKMGDSDMAKRVF